MPIEPPTDEDRSRLADDLRERAALVLEHGWADYESVWSTGQVLGVRAVLNEPEAEDEACPVWAPTLWGVTEAEADSRRDYAATRWWFSAVARPLPQEVSDTRDTLHVPDGAGEHRDGLVRIMSRIPIGWGRWISHDAGWYPIIVQLDEQLAAIDPAYEIHQVKEKFGTLRYYFHASDGIGGEARGRMRELVRAAEGATETTCEKCGGVGELMTTPSSWLKTLCGPCAAAVDRGYRPAHERIEELTPDLPGLWQVTATDGSYQLWDLQRGQLSWNTGEDRGRIVTVLAWPQIGDRSLVVVEQDGVETEVATGEITEIRRMR
ncbi:hypothetical protein [Mycobacteroides abscessus]|uniref:hypothetical protein n=1 Tax=Mycobacteroides abscessus TaxID=36809 RepID=UPI0009A65ABB|nr:hypothetical protein [Mycobacteroides abscessus]